jgi:hypothetical protein
MAEATVDTAVESSMTEVVAGNLQPAGDVPVTHHDVVMSDVANEATHGPDGEQASRWPSDGNRMPHAHDSLHSLMSTLAYSQLSLTHTPHLPMQVPRWACRSQDHHMLRICTSSDSSASRKVRAQAAEELHSAHRMRQSVLVVLRARFVLDTARLDSVHRRPYASGGYQYGALLHQK